MTRNPTHDLVLGNKNGGLFVGRCPRCRAIQWVTDGTKESFSSNWHCEGDNNNKILRTGETARCRYVGHYLKYRACKKARKLV